jgi:hypothetical protein
MGLVVFIGLVAAFPVSASAPVPSSTTRSPHGDPVTVTVGSTTLAANQGIAAFIGIGIPVFQGDASGDYVLSSPATGTVVSWSFLSGGVATGKMFVLRVLRPADNTGTAWTAVATSAPVAVTSAALADVVLGPFATSLPIEAGDRIALQPVDDGYVPIETGVNGQDGDRYFTAPLGDGSTGSIDPGSTADNGQVVPVQATVQVAQTPPPASVTPPAISGSAVAGGQVSCSTGTWANNPTTYAYQWLLDGQNLAGETNQTHMIGAGEVGHQLACQVTATGAGGPSLSPATSPPVVPTPVAGQGPPPRNLRPPMIFGYPQAGHTMTCDRGTWSAHGKVLFTVTWDVANHVRLPNGHIVVQVSQIATTMTFVLGDFVPGAALSCTVTATDLSTGGTATLGAGPVTIQAATPALAPVRRVGINRFSNPSPTITPGFSPAKGRVVRAGLCSSGDWLHYPTQYHYEWFVLPVAPLPAPSLSGARLVGRGNTLGLSAAEESRYVVCRVTASNHAGAATALSSRYFVAPPDFGVHVNAIEITQGVQTPEVPIRSSFDPTNDHVAYDGVPLPWEGTGGAPVTVKLAAGHATVVRVYANSTLPVDPRWMPTMVLRAFRTGRELAPGPIGPDQPPPVSAVPVGNLGEDPTDTGQRTAATGAYTFTLPEAWTTGDVTFEAEANPQPANLKAGVGKCSACERTIILGPEHFNPVTSVHIDQLDFEVDTNSGNATCVSSNGRRRPCTVPNSFPNADPVWVRAQAATPLQLDVFPQSSLLDGTGIINAASYKQGFPCLTDCTISAVGDQTDPAHPFYTWQNAQLISMVNDWASANDTLSSHFPFAMVPTGLGFGGGVTNTGGGFDLLAFGNVYCHLYGDCQPRAMSTDSRPIDGIAHELHHGLGRTHADLVCGGQLKANGGDPPFTPPPWPPNNDGALDGVGLDTSSISPYTIMQSSVQSFSSPAVTWYDLMSYCGTTATRWISVRNWNLDVAYYAPGATFETRVAQRPAFRLQPPASITATRTLAVTAVYEPGPQQAVLANLAADTGAATPTSATNNFTLVGRNAAGQIIARAGAIGAYVHIDDATSVLLIVGKITAAGVRDVDVDMAGQLIARDSASRHTPTLVMLTPRQTHDAVIRWRSGDADHQPLQVTVQYSPDGGRTWVTVYTGPDHGSVILPSRYLRASSNARVRAYVSDGFNEAIATSPRFVALGAPPLVTITGPRRNAHTTAGGALNLTGTAFDDADHQLAGRSLVWRAGRQLLGTGTNVTTATLPAGRYTITLTARDRDGRTATASTTIVLTPVRPLVSVLRTPRRISPKAHTLTLRIASIIPATLTIGARTVVVDRNPRLISVAIRPGRATLTIVLVLRSGPYLIGEPVTVER